MTEPLSLEVLSGGRRAAARRVWRSLQSTATPPSLASTWDWTEAWLEHYGDAVRHCFVIASSRGVARGVALLTAGVVRQGPFPVRQLHIGTAGEPPGEGVYATGDPVLTQPGYGPEFAEALVARFRSWSRWDEIVLERFAPGAAEAYLHLLPGAAKRVQACPTVDLTAAKARDGDVLATLRPRTRQQIRRSVRTLGPVTTDVASTPAQALEILDELIALHQRRWQAAGKPGVFASPRFVGFHRALIERLAARGEVILVRVRARSATIGCVYHLVQGSEAISYQMGLLQHADPKVKPGFVSLAAAMQVCFERNLETYNLLPESAGYKRELANTEQPLLSATVVQPRCKTLVLEAARIARSRGREGLAHAIHAVRSRA